MAGMAWMETKSGGWLRVVDWEIWKLAWDGWDDLPSLLDDGKRKSLAEAGISGSTNCSEDAIVFPERPVWWVDWWNDTLSFGGGWGMETHHAMESEDKCTRNTTYGNMMRGPLSIGRNWPHLLYILDPWLELVTQICRFPRISHSHSHTHSYFCHVPRPCTRMANPLKQWASLSRTHVIYSGVISLLHISPEKGRQWGTKI